MKPSETKHKPSHTYMYVKHTHLLENLLLIGMRERVWVFLRRNIWGFELNLIKNWNSIPIFYCKKGNWI
jgi:hypothetical protein